jgi:hypothetical protein
LAAVFLDGNIQSIRRANNFDQYYWSARSIEEKYKLQAYLEQLAANYPISNESDIIVLANLVEKSVKQ